MFVKNEQVTYRGLLGTITFTGVNYVIIDIPPKEVGRNAPRLVVYDFNYSEIISQDSK